MTEKGTPDRRDLAAMVVELGRELVAAERPILAERDLTMWQYTVLCALTGGVRRSQASLADEIHADRTRLIPILDSLQARGLIERAPDPDDRRVHLLNLTPAGLRLQKATQRTIQHNELTVLRRLRPEQQRGLVEALVALTSRGKP